MRFLIILIFLIFNSFAIEASDIKNLVINKDLKKYEDLTFLDDQNNQIDLISGLSSTSSSTVLAPIGHDGQHHVTAVAGAAGVALRAAVAT